MNPAGDFQCTDDVITTNPTSSAPTGSTAASGTSSGPDLTCQPQGSVGIEFVNDCTTRCRFDAGLCMDLFKAKALSNGQMPVLNKPFAQSVPASPGAPKSAGPTSAGPTSAAAKPAPATAPKPSGDSGKDSSSCKSLAKQAIQACNDDSSDSVDYSSYGKGSGAKKSCQDVRDAQRKTARAKNDAGQACYTAWTSCRDMCDSVSDSSTSSMCRQLSSKVADIGSSSTDSLDSSLQGSQCSDNTSDGGGGAPNIPNPNDPNNNPNDALNKQAANDPYGCQTNPNSAACTNCTLNPDTPTCKAIAAAQQNPTGTASFSNPNANGNDPSKFNVGDTNTGQVVPPIPPVASSTNGQPPPGGAVVPNNSGGAIPGDQNSKPPAGVDPRRPTAGSPGYSTDIEQGFQAGGFSSAPGGLTTGQAGGTFSGYGNGNGGRGPASLGMDLKKYLPGQRLDPTHRLGVGGNGMISPEINGPSADLFKKVSARILVKCKLGVLLDCH
jgi:hypothetical protein